VILFYYFGYLFTWDNGMQMDSGDLSGVIGIVIVIAVLSSVLKFAVVADEEEQDERDMITENKAGKLAYNVLMTLVIIFIGHLVFAAAVWEMVGYDEMIKEPTAIAQILLLIALLGTTSRGFAQLYYYRKGY
jgi:amino acid permease